MSIKKIVLLIALFSASLGFCQSNVLFDQATEYYNKGEYGKAIDNYKKILDTGEHSAQLYFNMGNCHYKLNAIGPSIYYYEKALLLDPNDAEIRNNLGYAQNMRLDAIESIPKTEIAQIYGKIVNLFFFDQWAYVAIGFAFLFVLGYLAYFFLRFANQKRIAFIVSIFSLSLSVVSILMAYLQNQEFKKDNPAIVFSKQVQVSSEPNNNSEIVFTLHEGTKVNVLDQLDDWRKIKLADGQTGWLLTDNIKLLKDF
ncbi:tetratricopeptide repeat protein [Flagellimonas alvinocaridis]|uniref:Tetratricopeptide repeat protein n=1 Tax=Flagellimonas alvinocaridis TaxID=2530200 RepID=A0A4S8RTS3_9FLAO|nr:tetratricopeptide repeat protein [Allomuricauda alvinocaridis]THV61412.1 tetratricopeptide repeat protein [Allomuricauda alvinocaridis]